MDDDGSLALAEQRIGSKIAGCYTLLRLIGIGGAGAVYEAMAVNGSRVALKVLHSSISRMPDMQERFHREALIARRIFHTGVARILDDGMSAEGDVYIAMELLEGETIEARASRTGGVLPMGEVIAIAKAALEIVDAAHRAGVVHRDLKPDNIFLTMSRTLKVLDFGIARLESNDRRLKRTRTGIIMGTPAFMAPEQARASWARVDKRTDVWAMGAIMFTLLSGRPVHAGESVGEVLAAAAIRPAPSLGRVVAAPVPLVRVVDRALCFDQHERFADAAEMRAALAAAIDEIRAGAAVTTDPSEPEAAPPVELETLEEREPGEAGASAFALIEATDEQRKTLREFFKLLELGLLGVTQYGLAHPETEKRIVAAVASAVTELARTGEPASWNVTPYSFTAGGVPVWEPDTPHDRIPYQLFADGIRVVTIMPGLTNPELDSFLRLIMKDRLRELAPEDDFVTLLWEADFEHVVYQAIDSFGGGDLTRRSRFEQDVRGIQSLGHAVTRGQIAQSFARRSPARSITTSSAGALKLLGRDGVDTASLVTAEAMLTVRGVPVSRAGLDLNPEMLRVLSARLAADSNLVDPKFARSVALAWSEARLSAAVEPLAQKLRAAIDGMAVGRPDVAIRAAAGMCGAAGASRHELARAMLSVGTFKKALGVARATPQVVDPAALRLLVDAVDGAYFDAALETMLAAADGPLKDLLLSFMKRPGLGNEGRLGHMLATATEDVGVALVRILAKIGTPEATAAMTLASRSPHGIVRIEALGHVEGANSDRMRSELKALLEDADAVVRMAALKTIHKNNVRVAGPSLVLRIKAPKFDGLPPEERREALRTLAFLAPRRGEEVATELLANAGLLPSEAHDLTRAIAAELLSRIGRTEAARDALAAAASSRWRSSEQLRTVAEAALKRLARVPVASKTEPPPSQQRGPSNPSAPPTSQRPGDVPPKGGVRR